MIYNCSASINNHTLLESSLIDTMLIVLIIKVLEFSLLILIKSLSSNFDWVRCECFFENVFSDFTKRIAGYLMSENEKIDGKRT